jgi:NADPH2:quinone reductase
MRAIVINRNGGPDVLELSELPAPVPGPGQLLVQVGGAGVNYRDVYERVGMPGQTLPLVAGIEGAGRVEAVGTGVSGISAGDRIGWVAAQGSYAEQVLVEAEKAVPLADGVSDELAAAVLLQGMTAHYLCVTTHPIEEGETALVHAGAGGVGLLLVQMVKHRGGRVIATTSTEEKAALVRAAGADEVIGYEGFAERVRELTGGEGVPVVYDGVGRATFDEGLGVLRRRGTMALFGSASGHPLPFDTGRLMASGSLWLTRPSLRDYTATREELLWRAGEVFAWIADGWLDVRIGGRYPLADARRAHEDLEGRRTTGKLLLLPS